MIKGVLSVNSQMFHIVINGCNNVRLQGISIKAPESSPNTDGIHVQLSSNIAIVRSIIRTGDDCISIGPGTCNLWIERVKCGPGHGIRSETFTLTLLHYTLGLNAFIRSREMLRKSLFLLWCRDNG